ncbi:GNAT family N-acetyltransferase [Scatolibacter rhodanostii]|uniref:GNAT family N-acetyltransferase n=1 Tax=Scatolibacter rhodanostii TaxID=2014781 RepID=UPI000C078D36|nr:GNAT family N-acetyltransferase [Scatolibacter rhodanostii]
MLMLRMLENEDIEIVEKWLNQEYISKWFGDASDWLHEIYERNITYKYLRHFIAQDGDKPIGFCQYYNYNDLPIEHREIPQPTETYGIDYLLGDENLLGKGIGKQLVHLISQKLLEENAKAIRIIADPTIEDGNINIVSIKTLEANGFRLDKESRLYIKDIN